MSCNVSSNSTTIEQEYFIINLIVRSSLLPLLLLLDYPGIGESTFQADRTLVGWADDVSEFLDKLNLERVRLLGHSLGGLHALALLSNRSFKKRVIRTVLLCPWLNIEGESFNPTWMKLTHVLPDVFQSSIIPFVLTGLSSSTIKIATWSNPELAQFQATKLVMDYTCLQGQAGNEQMVRFALSKYETYLPEDSGPDSSPILIFHGKDDALVSECRTLELVRLLKERNCDVTYTAVNGGDHNSILSKTENLINVMASLVGDADTWAAEIAKSLGVHRSQSLP